MGIRVLSLFDGCSCARIALERAGITVDTYYASELDETDGKYAAIISKKNYPDIIRLGDVTKIDFSEYIGKVDLICGGSPCQGFSFAGKQLNFDDPRSVLFFEFLKAVNTIKPKYFLLENVRMDKLIMEKISRLLGVNPVFINSSLVSAQNRQRYYWTNIPGFGTDLFGTAIVPPEDRHIMLADILQPEHEVDEKYYLKNQEVFDCIKRKIGKYVQVNPKKSCCLITSYPTNWNGTYVAPQGYRIRKDADKASYLVANPNGGTRADFYTVTRGFNKGGISSREKCPTLTTSKFKNNNFIVAMRGRPHGGKVEQMLEPRTDGKTNCITTVEKDNLLNSGDRIRRLTPIECERLQTLPDNYTAGVSDSQRYKMLGNGWTVDVIAHIFNGLLK